MYINWQPYINSRHIEMAVVLRQREEGLIGDEYEVHKMWQGK